MLLGPHEPVALVLCQNICAEHVAFSTPFTQSIDEPDYIAFLVSFVKSKRVAVGIPDIGAE